MDLSYSTRVNDPLDYNSKVAFNMLVFDGVMMKSSTALEASYAKADLNVVESTSCQVILVPINNMASVMHLDDLTNYWGMDSSIEQTMNEPLNLVKDMALAMASIMMDIMRETEIFSVVEPDLVHVKVMLEDVKVSLVMPDLH